MLQIVAKILRLSVTWVAVAGVCSVLMVRWLIAHDYLAEATTSQYVGWALLMVVLFAAMARVGRFIKRRLTRLQA